MLPAIIPIITSVIDKLLPDPKAADDAKLKVLELAQRGELATLDADMRLALAQTEVNKAEAATDAYRGGWRPFCGWVCGAGLAYQFLVQPLAPWIVAVSGVIVPQLPAIDTGTLMTLLCGMLGLGGLRTYEKQKGVA